MGAWLQRSHIGHAIRTPARNQLQVGCDPQSRCVYLLSFCSRPCDTSISQSLHHACLHLTCVMLKDSTQACHVRLQLAMLELQPQVLHWIDSHQASWRYHQQLPSCLRCSPVHTKCSSYHQYECRSHVSAHAALLLLSHLPLMLCRRCGGRLVKPSTWLLWLR